MAAKKGVPNPNAGRPPGSPNKATTEFKEAVNNLLLISGPNFLSWLERVAATDPAKALDLCAKLAEYAYPKLARSEITGANGGPIDHTVSLPTEDKEIINRYMKEKSK